MEPDRCQKYKIFWIIKLQLLQKDCTGNICYCSYVWHAQLIRSVFQLNVSFSCWIRSIGVPFCVFCSLLNFYQGCQRTRTLWNWCLNIGRSLLRRWQVVAICHNSQCGDNTEECETSQQLKYQNFQSIGIQIEGTLLYFLRWRQSWHTLNKNCLYWKKYYLASLSFQKFKMLNQKFRRWCHSMSELEPLLFLHKHLIFNTSVLPT